MMGEVDRLDGRSVALGVVLAIAAMLLGQMAVRVAKWLDDSTQLEALDKFAEAHDSVVRLATSLSGQNLYGFMVVSGVDLDIRYMDTAMQRMWKKTWTPASKVRVEDLLPESMRPQHARWMQTAYKKGALPGSLLHPLRNVELLQADGSFLKCHVSIGALEGVDRARGGRGKNMVEWLRSKYGPGASLGLCCAVVVPVGPEEQIDHADSWKSGLNFLYGESIGRTIAGGEVPKQENP
ncbi:hypothetical protein T484DRAFT_1865965 [Baffinella frigidus]|nr:hypothetical protein T484DRAFT_1865965 [Cryptophyta sp. CCMP2293]